mgnify:CR=1 FL=1
MAPLAKRTCTFWHKRWSSVSRSELTDRTPARVFRAAWGLGTGVNSDQLADPVCPAGIGGGGGVGWSGSNPVEVPLCSMEPKGTPEGVGSPKKRVYGGIEHLRLGWGSSGPKEFRVEQSRHGHQLRRWSVGAGPRSTEPTRRSRATPRLLLL